MNNIHNDNTDAFFNAILSLKNKQECYSFFEDICTVREIEEISRRLQVALLLDKGMVYNEIAQKTGASTATISRVNRCLGYGTGGYMTVLSRIKNNDNADNDKTE